MCESLGVATDILYDIPKDRVLTRYELHSLRKKEQLPHTINDTKKEKSDKEKADRQRRLENRQKIQQVYIYILDIYNNIFRGTISKHLVPQIVNQIILRALLAKFTKNM